MIPAKNLYGVVSLIGPVVRRLLESDALVAQFRYDGERRMQ